MTTEVEVWYGWLHVRDGRVVYTVYKNWVPYAFYIGAKLFVLLVMIVFWCIFSKR